MDRTRQIITRLIVGGLLVFGCHIAMGKFYFDGVENETAKRASVLHQLEEENQQL